MSARLHVAWPGGDRVFELTAAEYVVGRDADADIVIPLPFISRVHARLVAEGGGYRYIHLGANPTLSRDGPVTNRILRQGDELFVGPQDQAVRLVLELPTLAPGNAEEATRVGALELLPERAIVIGRDPSSDLVLDNPLVSRRHVLLRHEAGGAFLEDLASTNGTYVNGQRIQTHAISRGDVIRVGPYKLLYADGDLIQYDESNHAQLTGYHLRVTVGRTLILDDVSVSASPGEITAIAGVSGAGKSTLLNALGGLAPVVRGRVLLNDADLLADYSSLRALLGYVPQADIVNKELPLQRALHYAARLRLPTDAPRQEIEASVAAVISQLDLTGQRHLAIRRMSGGQQKRASLAVELIAKPPLLLLDEPTSGLDPGLRRQLMELLREFSRQGRTIVLVTHDPDTLAYCDQMVFLTSGGKVAFLGPPLHALAYFDVPDYVEIYRRVEGEGNPEGWRKRFLDSPQYLEYVRRRLPLIDEVGSIEIADPQPAPTRLRNGPGPARLAADGSYDLSRVGTLSVRYAEVLVRDVRNLALLLLQAPILALLLGLVSTRQALTAGTTSGEANKVLLLMATCAVWLGTINSAREVVKELPMYVRERLMGIGPVPYVLSKAAILSVLCLAQSFLLLLFLAFRVRLPHDGVLLPGPLELFLTIALTSLAGMAMGLLISGWSSSQERAMTLVPLVLIPQIILAGVIFKLSGLASVLSYFSIAKWSVELLGSTAGIPGGDYPASVPHQLIRWFVLAVMTVAFLSATVWLLARKDTSPLTRP